MLLKLLKSIFLIVGTAIGAGILALPIVTVSCGFWGSFVGLIITWVFMTLAANFMLRARLYFNGDADLSTMSVELLGKPPKIIIEICYLSLLFALIAIYVTVGSAWLGDILFDVTGTRLNPGMAQTLFTVLIAGLIFSGLGRLATINKIVTIAMLLLLMLIISFSMPKVEIAKILDYDLSCIPATLPMLSTTFGFSIILPSLVSYLDYDKKLLARSLVIGSLIILFTYLAWELIAFGVIGGDSQGLAKFVGGKDQGTEVIYTLSQIVDKPVFNKVGFAFMFTALLSSVFGVGQCLFSYLKDALPIRNNKQKSIAAILLGFLTPLVLINFYPAGVSSILSFAGIFVAVILGIVPSVMIMSKKYKATSTDITWADLPIAILTIIFFTGVIAVEAWRIAS